MTTPAADRPPERPARDRLTRDGSRIVTARLTAPDRERLTRALDGRGLSLSEHLRGLILRDLDDLESAMT